MRQRCLGNSLNIPAKRLRPRSVSTLAISVSPEWLTVFPGHTRQARQESGMRATQKNSPISGAVLAAAG